MEQTAAMPASEKNYKKYTNLKAHLDSMFIDNAEVQWQDPKFQDYIKV